MDTKIRIAAIIVHDGQLLMQKGKGYDELWTPGGKPLPGESDKECLARELQEELGVILVTATYFGEFTGKSPYGEHLNKNKVYLCTISGDPLPDHEIEKVIWFSKNDFLSKTYPMIAVTENEIIPALIKANVF